MTWRCYKTILKLRNCYKQMTDKEAIAKCYTMNVVPRNTMNTNGETEN